MFLRSPALVWRQETARSLLLNPGSLTSLPPPTISSGKGTKGFRRLLRAVDLPSLRWSPLGKVAEAIAYVSHWMRDWVGQGSCPTGFSGTPRAPSEFLNLIFQQVKLNQGFLSSSSQLSQPSELYRPVQILAKYSLANLPLIGCQGL